MATNSSMRPYEPTAKMYTKKYLLILCNMPDGTVASHVPSVNSFWNTYVHVVCCAKRSIATQRDQGNKTQISVFYNANHETPMHVN